MCTQKCGFLPKVWLRRFRWDLYAVSILRLRTTAILNLPFWGNRPYLYTQLAMKNMSLRTGWAVQEECVVVTLMSCFWTLILISAHFSKHECMLKSSAQSNIILRPFGNHGYFTRVERWHLPHHLQRWMSVTVSVMSYCVPLLISNLLCMDREHTNICEYNATVSKVAWENKMVLN